MFQFSRMFPYSSGVRIRFFLGLFSLTVIVLLSKPLLVRPHNLLPAIAQRQVLPLDPLSFEEIELATRIASADPGVKKELGPGRHQLIQIQHVTVKPDNYASNLQEQQPLEPDRHAGVWFYRYDTDQGVHVLVDLGRRSVVGITRLEGKAVPLALEEVNRAFNLALLNRQVRRLLGSQANEFAVAGPAKENNPTNRVEGLRVLATSPRDPCYRHRCIELRFRSREGYISATSVTVDLSAQRVKVQNIAR